MVITLGANPTYNGLPQAPTITVADPNTEVNNQPLKPTDYSVTYQLVNADGTTTDLGATKPTNAGSYNVVVTYKGSQGVQPFQIEKRAISDSTIAITAPKPATYTGSAIAVPSLTIKGVYGDALNPNTQTLVAGKDYEVVAPAGGMINATAENSPYELTINGLGNYSGSTTQDFVVNKAPFSTVNAVLTNADKLVFNGSSTPAATFDVTFNGVKIDSSKYDVSSTGTTTGKDVLVTLTPKSELSNFTGTKQVTVNILKSIEGAQLVSAIPTQTWGEGDWQKPSFALSYNGKELTEDTDYTVKYGENTSAGVNAGVITVTGIGEYSGTKVINYTIDGIDAEITEVVVSDEAVFNGKVQNPADFVTFKVTYEDENGVEQTLDPSKYTAVVKTNSEFKNAATYGLEISIAAGQYEAPAVTTETITMAKANLTTLKPKATADTYLYTYKADGTTIQPAAPEFVVTLDGEPYTLVTADYTWPNTFTPATDLKTVGQYAPTIEGAGNFEGSATVKFNVAQDISMLYVTPITAVTYNGKAQTPEFKVYSNKAAADADTAGNADIKNAEIDSQDSSKVITNYTVSWNSNTNAGTAQLVLTGHGPNYGGTKTVDFVINKAAGTMTVAAVADQTYTGSAIQPEPVATITANGATVASTFAYSYANNTNAGTATVTVVPMGVGANYDVAPATVSFKINAANMSAVAYSGDTKVAVNKQPTIKLTYNGKELVAGTDYDVTETPVTSKAGKATLKVTGKGNFTGVKTIDITVEDASTPVNPDVPTTTEGWKHNSTGWWYETGEGSYVTSAWKKINGNWYYFNKSGYMMTGWQKINGTWYYLNKKGEGTEGAMVSNAWKKINGAWYNFDKNGAMRTGWYKENGIWYYLNKAGEGTEGKMVANQWKQINGSWFFFHSGGAMATSQYVGPYWVDANGYWVR